MWRQASIRSGRFSGMNLNAVRPLPPTPQHMSVIQGIFGHIHEDDIRKFFVNIIAGVFGLIVHIAFIALFNFIGATTLSLVNIGSAVAWLTGLYCNFKGRHNLAIYIYCTEILVHAVIATAVMGTSLGFQHYLWAITGLAVINTIMPIRIASLFGFCFVFVFALLNFLFHDVVYPYKFAEYVQYIHFTNALFAGLPLILAAIAVRHITVSQEQRLHHLATVDSLTGLHNRHFVRKAVGARQSVDSDQQGHASLALCDIDHFKQINDKFGHGEGDIVLQNVADLLRSNVKECDIVARWGGEEFLLLLWESDGETAYKQLEEIRQIVCRTINVESDQTHPVSISAGIAEWKPGQSFEQSFKLADEALYLSKDHGRNRVTWLGQE